MQGLVDHDVTTDVIIAGCAGAASLPLLIAVCSDRLFQRAALPVSLAYWLLLMTSLYAFVAVRHSARPSDAVAFAYYVIVTSYVMLPAPRVWCVVLGVATGVLHLVVIGVVAPRQDVSALMRQVS